MRAKPAKSKEAKSPVARKPPKDDGARVRDLEKGLAEALSREADASAREAEALEQKTATAEILRVISQSQTDVQPVFDTIVANSVRLCRALYGLVYRLAGGLVHAVAHYNLTPEEIERRRRRFPRPLSDFTGENPLGRALTTGRVSIVADIEAAPAIFTPEFLADMRARVVRSQLVVPMVRQGQVIGAILVQHHDAGAFTDARVELLKTFADQAVIAIENARLFNETKEALERQTATAEILRVISESPTNVQPVFDMIAVRATTLCDAELCIVQRVDGEQLHLAAISGVDPAGVEVARKSFPMAVSTESGAGRAVRTRGVVHLADVLEDPTYALKEQARAMRFRSGLAVPMLREGHVIGVIVVMRTRPGYFTATQVELLKTFAAQAVIAIENVRLLTELQARTGELTRSVEQLTALGDVGRAVSSSLDLDTVLSTIVGRAVQLSGTDGGTIFEYDESAEEFMARATLNPDEGQSALLRAIRLRRGEGAVGQMAVTRQPIQIPDIAAEGAYESRIRGAMLDAGTRSVLAIPLLHEEQLVGGLVVTRRVPGAFTVEVVDLLRTFATQSALAIQNARLFREIEVKSHQLEVASQHKSEFLANMSHELRTPLNAIIGFSEVLSERMFGELNEKQEEYLKDIYASGTHLLSLINDILDLSKIEAGRMELELTDFHLPTALDSALTLVRERAGRRGIALQMNVDSRLGQIQADERKVRQVVLNLLSNAIKFTPEGGRIDVGAVPKDGLVEVSVSDTGVGIAPEDQEAVFEEFRQVGTADKKVEGTGLGLTLCRKFVELHGGRIWVKSELGAGSTFTFTIPVRHGE
jgi:two-component system, NtrC family, sensor kinase